VHYRLAVGNAKDGYWISISIKPPSNNFMTKVQLSTKSDAFLSTHILLSLINFVNLLYSTSKMALPRHSRVSYKSWMDEQKLVMDSLQTINFTFPAVTWKNIAWSFSMPLWCNKHLPRKSTIYCFAFFGMFVSRVLSGVASSQNWAGKPLDFKQATVFVFDTASQTTKRQETKKFGEMAPLPTSMRVLQPFFA